MRNLTKAAVLALAFTSTSVLAHTTSLGYVPGSAPGEVTFWTGSYSHSGTVVNEGTGTLTNLATGATQTGPFNIGPVSTKPLGLVDGVNNFFWGPSSGGSYPFPVSTDPNLFGGVVAWQGITFTGLTPGNYDFGCGTTCGTSVQWASLNSGPNTTVQVTLTGRDVGGAVPEPGTWAMMLLGFGAIGFGMRRRKEKSSPQRMRVSYS